MTIPEASVGYLRAEFRGAKEGPHWDIGLGKNARAATAKETMQVHDAREAVAKGELELSLDTCGFVLLQNETKCANFRNKDTIRKLYYPEVVDLVRRHTGAEKALVTGHIVRAEIAGYGYKLDASPTSAYADLAHLDFNGTYNGEWPSQFSRFAQRPMEKGGLPRRAPGVPGVDGDDAASLGLSSLSPVGLEQDYDFVAYNVWQPIEREVLQHPLVLLDARTVEKDADLWPGAQKDTLAIGGDVFASHNPKHRWWYFSRMRTDEVLVFMGHKFPEGRESPHPGGSGAQSPHTSVRDPSTPTDAPDRRSVETRVLAAFPKKSRTSAMPTAKL